MSLASCSVRFPEWVEDAVSFGFLSDLPYMEKK
jgi:hypothetical protein